MLVLSLDVPGTKIGGYVSLDLATNEMTAGTITFRPEMPESHDFLVLWHLLEEKNPQLIILERPFLFMIAGWIGACKMYAAAHGIPWWQTGASSAKKKVIGKGNASKAEVFEWAKKHPDTQPVAALLTQHVSDSFLYLCAWRKSNETQQEKNA